MGRYIARLGEDQYIEWSTVVDAPVSYLKTRAVAVKKWGEDRIERADRQGTSILDGYPAGSTPEEIIEGNRAGEREETLTLDELLAAYAAPSSRTQNRMEAQDGA